MPKLSVIIPVYKAEKYIEKCAVSLLEQTLDDIEYIFIDDCTPDNSINILKNVIKHYPSRENSIRIIKMEANSQQAAVRSCGIKLSTGDYIVHCDSDDWVDVEYYKSMYDEAIRSNADIVFAPVVNEYANSSILKNFVDLPTNGREIVKMWHCTNIPMFTVNKLVRRELYSENEVYPFEGINMWEDNGLMLRLLYFAEKVSYVVGPAYHYNHTNISATTKGYGRSAVYQMIRCAELLDAFYAEKEDRQLYNKTINALKFLAKLNLITTTYKGLHEFKKIFPESNEAVHYISLNAFSTKGKVRFFFVKYNMAWLFVALFRFMGQLYDWTRRCDKC